jgi:hypothetical protein
MIARIISGGQTGVDIAALRAAKAKGIPTGGTMPKGFRTLAGPKPEWAAEFGLVEHTSDAYPPRTWRNVRDSDITVRIALDFKSSGEKCTEAAIVSFKKQSMDLLVRRYRGGLITDEDGIWGVGVRLADLADELRRDTVINFAGSSEKTAPGIEFFAEGVVRMIIEATYG